jgi:hypothetical protein
MRWLLALAFALPLAAAGGSMAEIAKAIRENSFDRDECYRVRDLRIAQEDIKIYLTDGRLIFSKPVAGQRIAAVFIAEPEGGDGEVILLPPDRAERRSMAVYTGSPNLDDHFHTAVLMFTGDVYEKLKQQIVANPANRKSPESALLLEEQWTPVLRTLGASYETRLTLDLVGGPARRGRMFAGVFASAHFPNFDVIYDPDSTEQIVAGQIADRGGRRYFDTWTSFVAQSERINPAPRKPDLLVRSYRIEATVSPDLTLSAVTRLKVQAQVDGMAAVGFDIAPQMEISQVSVNGTPAEVLQRDALRANILRQGNELALVAPAEPLRQGREYEFEFHHSGKVILDAGNGVYYVSARANWYPIHRMAFADYDLLFRYPRDLDLVTPGDVVEDRTEGEWRITRRRTAAPIRMAGFNLGKYEHARETRGPYAIDVCGNRGLESALRPKPAAPPMPLPPAIRGTSSREQPGLVELPPAPAPDPLARLTEMASQIASALDFMASRFGPPALPHLTVSPIPGAFGQGFPGLIYLSTLAYLKGAPAGSHFSQEQQLFFEEVLQAHETAHQWWGNRITTAAYRDYWLMEALANYSALLYLEKSKGQRAVDLMLDQYRQELLAKNEIGQTVESAGPIVLGTRLESSVEPRAWRSITYGKGSWILHMLRARMGDEKFLAMLAELARRYDRKDISTEGFRLLAVEFSPKSDDPKLEAFFDQWVYGTGIPSLKLSYALKGKAPALRLVGTLTQTGVDGDFSTVAPVEIQFARGRAITQWVRAGKDPVTFTVPLKQAPSKVTLDPRYGVLRTK